MWNYTNAVHEHFLHPHNAGPMEDANAIGEVGSLACGDARKLYLKINDDGIIEKASFETFGCASAIASSSVLTDMVKGMMGLHASFTLFRNGEEIDVSARSYGDINVQLIMEALGGGGHQTMAAAQLKHITPEAARSRIQTAIDQYREAQKKSGPESEPEQKKKDKQ